MRFVRSSPHLQRMGNVSVQKWTDVSNKETEDEASATKGNADEVRPVVCQGKGLLRLLHNQRVQVGLQNILACGEDVLDRVEVRVADKLRDLCESSNTRRGTCIDDEFTSERLVCHLGEILCDLVEEDVCVNAVADGSSNVSDAQCDGGDGSNLVIRACNLRDDGTRDDDTTHAD